LSVLLYLSRLSMKLRCFLGVNLCVSVNCILKFLRWRNIKSLSGMISVTFGFLLMWLLLFLRFVLGAVGF
jgi:hypothetical protein